MNNTFYIALGDSITEADPGFVSIVSKAIGAEYTINGGIYGCRSAELLDGIKKNETVREALTQATVITLDIGSNDVFFDIIENIAGAFGCKPTMEDVYKNIENTMSTYNKATGFRKLLLGFQLMSLGVKVHNAVYTQSKIQSHVNEFKTNFNNILKELKTLAPNAKVYVGNLYNPYINTDPMMVGSYKIYDVDEVAELWEKQYNTVIKEATATYKHTLVNINGVIKSKSQLLADVSKGNWDPHPNAKGYKDIADAFIKVMK